jgi:hypothetical protein
MAAEPGIWARAWRSTPLADWWNIPSAIAAATVFLLLQPEEFGPVSILSAAIAGLAAAVFTTLLRFLGNLIAEPYRTLNAGILSLSNRLEEIKDQSPVNRNEWRREKIARLRSFLIDFDWERGDVWETPEWSELRSIISQDVVRTMEGGIRISPVLGIGRVKTDKAMLLDEVAKTEREWGLI